MGSSPDYDNLSVYDALRCVSQYETMQMRIVSESKTLCQPNNCQPKHKNKLCKTRKSVIDFLTHPMDRLTLEHCINARYLHQNIWLTKWQFVTSRQGNTVNVTPELDHLVRSFNRRRSLPTII